MDGEPINEVSASARGDNVEDAATDLIAQLADIGEEVPQAPISGEGGRVAGAERPAQAMIKDGP